MKEINDEMINKFVDNEYLEMYINDIAHNEQYMRKREPGGGSSQQDKDIRGGLLATWERPAAGSPSPCAGRVRRGCSRGRPAGGPPRRRPRPRSRGARSGPGRSRPWNRDHAVRERPFNGAPRP